ncbi:MAG: cache domain-containing protein [Anaerolineales bacterium]
MNKLKGIAERFNFIKGRPVRLPIAARLTLSFLSVILLSSLIFTLVGTQIITNLITSEAEERVRNDLNAARLIYDDALQSVRDAAEFTAVRNITRQILNGHHVHTYIDEMIWFKVSEGLDILTITDSTGTVVFRANDPDRVGDDQSRLELVAAVLQRRTPVVGTVILSAEDLRAESELLAERAYFQFVDTPMARPRPETEETAGMALMAAVPVFDEEGNFIGVVYAAKLLNRNYEIVDEIKQTVFQGVVYEGKDIGTATIFQDDVRISTNVYNEDGSRAIGTRIAENVYNQVVLEGRPWLGRAYVVNNWYISAYEPIYAYDGSIKGILYVGILEQKYLDIKNRAILIFTGITLTGVLVSIFITIWISRRISQSVNVLVKASQRLASGTLDVKVEKISNDEFGELAETFNYMAQALRERDERLKEYAKRKIMESERLALIGQLAANVAHDLNNPLQGIVTYSYLLLESETCNPEEKENVQKIVTQANRCRDIIRGLLDFSRQKKPDKTLCDVNNLLTACVSLVERQALFHNIKVNMDLEENLPRVILDPSQMERVFLNLIINAAEAMDGNGQLFLSTRHNREGNCVEIKVRDTGHGISEENLEKIFDPFFTTKETGHGVGLGLAISFGIIKEHNGHISVESTPGQGATFTVSLPLTTETLGMEKDGE